MGNDLMAYIERLELMAFFSGYPLIYTIVQVIAGEQRKKTTARVSRLVKLLPFAYAFTGTLFIGLILKDMSPDFSAKNIAAQFQFSYLKIWGMLSILFWIPAFSRKPVFTLLHSLVFFSLLLKDLFMHMTSSIGNDMIKNDMKIYTDSLLLNSGTLVIVIIINFILLRIRHNKISSK